MVCLEIPDPILNAGRLPMLDPCPRCHLLLFLVRVSQPLNLSKSFQQRLILELFRDAPVRQQHELSTPQQRGVGREN